MKWKTVKLGKICTIEKGTTGIQKAIPGEYPMVVTSEERKSHNEFQFDDEAVIIPLVSSSGHGHRSLKRIHFQTGKFALGSILCAVIPKDKNVLSPAFLYRYLDLNKENELVARMRGMANVSLPIKEIADIEIPLPPIEKQLALVKKFDLLEKETGKLSIELTHQLSLVKQLRQQLLQEAVQGKLVTDQPIENEAALAKQYGKLWKASGTELLAQIRAEKAKLLKEKKIKADKALPPILEGEMPFELPEGWVWCRLGEVAIGTEGGKSPNCLHQPAEGQQWGVIKTTAIQEGYFLENENKVLPPNFRVSEQHKIYEGDLLITRAGPKNRVGVVCYVEELTRNLILSDKTIRIKYLKGYLIPQFIVLALNAKPIKSMVEAKMTGMADSQVNISQDNINGFPVPFPSIKIQHRIVAQLTHYQSLCTSLEAQIQESLALNGALLQEVLQEALST
jgi:type I restriction enzyme, S subunit